MQDLDASSRALLHLTLFFEPQNHQRLLSRATAAPAIAEHMAVWADATPDALREQSMATVRRLGSSMKSAAHKQAHPDWVAEKIKSENPALAAVILRNLPADHARTVLERLPEAFLKSLPSIGETFGVDRELNDVVMRLFDREFGLQESIDDAPGVHVALAKMNGPALTGFFRELGFRELALALSSLGDSAVTMVMGRMTVADSELLKSRMVRMQRVPELRHKQAQANVLAVDVDKNDRENFIPAVGLSMYAKSLVEESLPLHSLIRLKLPLPMARLLDGFVRPGEVVSQPSLATRYQKDLLEVLKLLKS